MLGRVTKIRRRIAGTLLVVAGLVGAAPLAADAAPPPARTLRELEAVGSSKAGDEKSAEIDAMRKAVLAIARELLGPPPAGGDPAAAQETEAKLEASLLRKARRFCPEIRVLDRTEAGTTVILKVRVKVAIDAVRAELVAAGLLVAEGAHATTRVLVLPAGGKGGPAPWWVAGGEAGEPKPITAVLVQALRDRGFDVVEPRAAPGPAAKAAPPTADLSDAAVLALGAAHDADVVVRVAWETTTGSRPVEPLLFGLARAKLAPVEAIAVKDGRRLTSVEGIGTAGETLDPRVKVGLPAETATRLRESALRSAAEEAAAKLLLALGEPVSAEGAPSTIRLTVTGLDTYVAFNRFERVLATQAKTVRAVTLKSLERGSATFDLKLERGADLAAFTDEIARQEFAEFSVKLAEKRPGSVVLQVVR